MLAKWALSIVVLIFKGKVDVKNCGLYRSVKLHQHGRKVVKRVLEKRLCRIVIVDEIQFGFITDKITIDLFIFSRLQEEYHAEEFFWVYVSCRPRESF